MTKRSWLAMFLALVLLAAIPAQAGTRTTTTKRKVTTSRTGFIPMGVSPQMKLWWCPPGIQSAGESAAGGDGADWGLPDQTAGTQINFGTGWAVFEEVQAWRVRDLQYGTLKLQYWDGDSWETYDGVDLSWTSGRFGDGSYAWGEPYSFPGGNNATFWRTDFELLLTLPVGEYRFVNIDFGLEAGTVDAGGGGDPPGPWMQYADPCPFSVNAAP